ncbi:uncharacterized protein LOC116211769 [Punica granatum]|uniref:Uncharacterized protein n=2 Tax=Punica granatum TaxID=22663 RepID=A0A218WT20_PUNGR|nr:uncharacterized protein LOC116211769 [Punica granatum]OWM75793.1 hypothetical protein CDL15_Pgr009437 [Punica granatum]PKI60495.1 hypothetical protein CRG98_019149 [Punica granatum]
MGSHHSFGSGLDRIINCSKPVSFEDDIYYAELERQILQLTADDEEDDSKPINFSPSKRASNAITTEAWFAAWADFAVPENDGNKNSAQSCVPSSHQFIKSNGTGVFIPHAVKSQTRSSSGRMSNNSRRRIYRQTAKNDNQRVYN